MIKVGVIGATGYTGEEIVRILAGHKNVEITVLQAVIDRETPISEILPDLKGKTDLICKKPDLDEACKKADILFLALPHTVSMKIAPVVLKAGKKAIDLSADYRLEVSVYEKWYKTKHSDKANIEEAVYGLPEFFKEKIKKAHFIANPGCYPTGTILAVGPLMEKGFIKENSVICDAKTGITGAGRKPGWNLDNPDIKGNFKAYKVNNHQHSPEINFILSGIAGKDVKTTFVPHLLPIERGILSTIYMRTYKEIGYAEVSGIFKEKYKNCPFVRIKPEGEFPQLKNVAYTNFFELGFAVDKEKKLIIAVSAIDNLLKGAAGQAVQNMNIMCGFDETEGLIS